MARVFVSHSSADEQVAADLNSWLAAEKHEVFLDRDPKSGLLVGDEWEARLYTRLRWAEAIVCVISRSYLQSPWCTAEVAIAKDRGIELLPVPIEPLEHPLMSMAVVQYTPNFAESPEAAKLQLKEKLNRIDPFGGFDWSGDRSPFPGLQPFDTDMHTAFFGRRPDVDALVRLLRSPASRGSHEMVIVVGASGCGKSSLVRAGLVPVIAKEEDWICLPPIVPGREPVAAVARGMATAAMSLDLRWNMTDVRQRLAGDDGLLDLTHDLLLAGRKRRGQLLIVVDQFEELFNQGSSESANSFAQLLHSSMDGPVQVVATIRPESMRGLLTDSKLAALQVRAYPLRPLGQDGLREVIEGPARLAGFKVDSTLVERLVADTGTGEALPLLAFTLAELARGRHWGDQLSIEQYEQLGGVKGSLQRQADEALGEACAACGRRPEDVINGLLELVTPDERGDPTRRRMPRDELPQSIQTELKAFVDRRLLTTDLDATADRVMISVAHEAFLSAWPPLAEAAKAQAAGLRSRRDVEAAANDWDQAGRPPKRLWEGNQLAAAVEATGARLHWAANSADHDTEAEAPRSGRKRPFIPVAATRTLSTEHVSLSPVGRTFLQRSIIRERWHRRRATTVLSALLALAVAGAGVAVGQYRNALAQEQRANVQRQAAIATELTSQAEALRNSQPRVSLMLGVESEHLRPAVATRRSLATTLMQTHFAAIVRGHKAGLNAVAISPDGYVLATASADNTVTLWDLRQGVSPPHIATLAPDQKAVLDVAFSPDGRIVAASSAQGTVDLWNVSDPSNPVSLSTTQAHASAVYQLAFSGDGKLLATASGDKTAILWDVKDPRQPHQLGKLQGHTAAVYALAFSPDSHFLATAGKDTTPILWDIRNPTAPARLADLKAHNEEVEGLAFSHDGRTLASASVDWTGILWDLSDPSHPKQQSSLSGFTDAVTAVAFSPDDHTLATANGDHTVVLWNVEDRSHPSRMDVLSGHTDWVTSVAFSPAGDKLVSGSLDRSAILWYTSARPEPVLLDSLSSNPEHVLSAAISPDGRTVATGNDDGTADLWDISYRSQASWITNLAGHSDTVRSVDFSPDGKTLATASYDGHVILWNLADRSHPAQIAKLDGDGSEVSSVAFSRDGRTLAATTLGGRAILWDLSDRARPNRLPELTGYHSLRAVAFSSDKQTLVMAGDDGVATIWDIKDRAAPVQLADMPMTAAAVVSVAISPDGRTVATGTEDQTVILWDIRDRARPVWRATISDLGSSVFALKFDPRGQILVASSGNNTATIWDVSDRSRPVLAATLHGLTNGLTNVVTAVAMNDVAGMLAAASWDGHTQLWDLDDFRSFTADAIGLACNIAGPNLSRAEWARFIPQLPYDSICSKDFPIGDRCVVGSWLLQDDKMHYTDQSGNEINQEGGAGAKLVINADGTAIYTYDQPGGNGSSYRATGTKFNATATVTGVVTSQVSTGPKGAWNETIQLDNVVEKAVINDKVQPATKGGSIPATSYACSGNQLVLQGYGDTQTWTRMR